MKNSQFNKVYEKKCDICGKIVAVSKTGNGECKHCGWYNNMLGEMNEDKIIFPNVVSLNKAKRLYREKRNLRPDLNDFLEMLHSYSEVEFWYKGLNYCLFLRDCADKKIEFGCNPSNICYFIDKDDFIQNAKIGNEYLKNI